MESSVSRIKNILNCDFPGRGEAAKKKLHLHSNIIWDERYDGTLDVLQAELSNPMRRGKRGGKLAKLFYASIHVTYIT